MTGPIPGRARPLPRFRRCARAVLAAALFLSTACATSPQPSAVPIAQGVTLDLPSPRDLEREVEAVQLVTARHGERAWSFEVRLSVTAERVLLVGTDSFGRRAFNVEWSDRGMTADKAAWTPDGLAPQHILADLVLLYWPAAQVRRGLHGAELVEDAHGRRVGDLIVVTRDPTAWSGQARLTNLSFGYALDVRSTQVSP